MAREQGLRLPIADPGALDAFLDSLTSGVSLPEYLKAFDLTGPVAAEPRVRPAFVRPFGNAQCATGNQAQIVPPPVTGYRGAWAAPIRKRRVR